MSTLIRQVAASTLELSEDMELDRLGSTLLGEADGSLLALAGQQGVKWSSCWHQWHFLQIPGQSSLECSLDMPQEPQ